MSTETRVYTEENSGYINLEVLEHFIAEANLRGVDKKAVIEVEGSLYGNKFYDARLFVKKEV